MEAVQRVGFQVKIYIFCKQYFCEDILFGGGVFSYSEIIGLCSDFLFFV